MGIRASAEWMEHLCPGIIEVTIIICFLKFPQYFTFITRRRNVSHKAFFSWDTGQYWGLNPGPHMCEACVLPLSCVPHLFILFFLFEIVLLRAQADLEFRILLPLRLQMWSDT